MYPYLHSHKNTVAQTWKNTIIMNPFLFSVISCFIRHVIQQDYFLLLISLLRTALSNVYAHFLACSSSIIAAITIRRNTVLTTHHLHNYTLSLLFNYHHQLFKLKFIIIVIIIKVVIKGRNPNCHLVS